MNDKYFDVPLRELPYVINGIREVEEVEKLKIKSAIMYINLEFHALNCVGQYDITNIVRQHNKIALWSFAKNHTINNPFVTVDIIVNWEE